MTIFQYMELEYTERVKYSDMIVIQSHNLVL